MVLQWLAFPGIEGMRMRNHEPVGIKVRMFVLNGILKDKKIYRQNKNKQKIYIFSDKNHFLLFNP